ncbi:MAG: 3-hydroxyanthranilate 3,4-dioxygenase [Phycisphaerales bacterium]|nr:3-hydroxyanthranilate 3,4-dioxygenase [Phycisphaerales bacterium]MCI0630135.1 3-hydroxyanthranilate 3,4-dioxygenase [Phycisphaerales bacterium]MCI0675934.1 3-hydroxyanthranilate 3,4-dioxygenase [Phycisphaerales bacterium]
MAIAPAARATVLPPIDLMKWVEQNRHRLKPPVSNAYVYDGEDFFVMVIAGPNARNDFHVTNSEEFFYQLKGDIVVRIIENGKMKDVAVREGQTFFVPGGVPHSPTRPPNTLGMVVERRRPAGETEHLQFYCEKCGSLVEDLEFDCKDIVDHFKQAMEDFWADTRRNTCKKCGTRAGKPKPIKKITFEPKVVIERET